MNNEITTVDEVTPLKHNLSAYYKRSFAYYTIKERLPVILTQTIDRLVRDKETIVEEYGEVAREELKTIIGDISKLKYEIQTNKPLQNLSGNAKGVEVWNKQLERQANYWGGVPTFFRSILLHSECYMYRRVREFFELTTALHDFDPFRKQKIDSFTNSIVAVEGVSTYLLNLLNDSNAVDAKHNFIKLLKLNLWGNRCDLSITNGADCAQVLDPLAIVEQYEPYILSDHSEDVWKAANSNGSNIIDIVNDNAGYELFTDFCIADFIITNKLATTIRFHVKSIPWFISDVMNYDFHWMIDTLKNSSTPSLHEIGTRWKNYVDKNVWTVVNNEFWTYPYDYTYMKNSEPRLYRQLSEAKLIIFKGDLNYRKLFGEIFWDSTTPVDTALQGFHPTKLCTLRTVKCDCICGLKPGIADKLQVQDDEWSRTGQYGLIQYSDLKD